MASLRSVLEALLIITKAVASADTPIEATSNTAAESTHEGVVTASDDLHIDVTPDELLPSSQAAIIKPSASPLVEQHTGESSAGTVDIGPPLLTEERSTFNIDINRKLLASLSKMPLPWGMRREDFVSVDAEGGFETPLVAVGEGGGGGKSRKAEICFINFFGDFLQWRFNPTPGYRYTSFQTEVEFSLMRQRKLVLILSVSGLDIDNFFDERVALSTDELIRKMVKFACRGKVLLVYGSMDDVHWLCIKPEDQIVVWDITNSPVLKRLSGRGPLEQAASLTSLMHRCANIFMQQGPRQRYRVGPDEFSAFILPNGYPAAAAAGCLYGHSCGLDVESHLWLAEKVLFLSTFAEIPIEVRDFLRLDGTATPPPLQLLPTLPVPPKPKLGDIRSIPPALPYVLILGFNNPTGRTSYAARFIDAIRITTSVVTSAIAFATNESALIIYFDGVAEASSFQEGMAIGGVDEDLVAQHWLQSKERLAGRGRCFVYDSMGKLSAGEEEHRQEVGGHFADIREEMVSRSGGQRTTSAPSEPTYLPDIHIRVEDLHTLSPPTLNTLIESHSPAPHLYPPPSLHAPHLTTTTADYVARQRGGGDFWLQWSDNTDDDVSTFSSLGLSFCIPSRHCRALQTLVEGGVYAVANSPDHLVSVGSFGEATVAAYPSVENYNDFPFWKVLKPHGMEWGAFAPMIGRSWHGGRTSKRFRGVRRRVAWSAVLYDQALTRPTLTLLYSIRDGTSAQKLSDDELACLPGAITLIEQHLLNHPTHNGERS